uniref:alpha/beta hydrolase-fold protein n=1 Tax=Ruminococcus sp. TaxID=41978 RepID=UPI0025DF28DA
MNSKINKFTAKVLAAVMLVCTLGTYDFGSEVNAAETRMYITSNLHSYSFDPTYNKGAWLDPAAEGDFPLMVLFHGSGGPGNQSSIMMDNMNKWLNKGYVDPMVFVMPKIEQLKEPSWGITDFGEFISNGYCEDLLEHINAGDLSKKIDYSVPYSVMGFSMGGAAALYAGCGMGDTFANVGGLSPAWVFYSNTEYGFVKNASDLTFPKNEDGHFMMSYGAGEDVQFKNNVQNFMAAIENNGLNLEGRFKKYVGPASVNGVNIPHGWNLFSREIFAFMYYMKNECLPTPEIVEVACGSGTEGIYGKVSINGTYKEGETVSAVVSDSNASDFTYKWRIGKNYISGATSSIYTLTSADVGKKISCEVADKTGKLVGVISGTAASETVTKSNVVTTAMPTTNTTKATTTTTKTTTTTAKPTTTTTLKATTTTAKPTTTKTTTTTAKLTTTTSKATTTTTKATTTTTKATTTTTKATTTTAKPTTTTKTTTTTAKPTTTTKTTTTTAKLTTTSKATTTTTKATTTTAKPTTTKTTTTTAKPTTTTTKTTTTTAKPTTTKTTTTTAKPTTTKTTTTTAKPTTTKTTTTTAKPTTTTTKTTTTTAKPTTTTKTTTTTAKPTTTKTSAAPPKVIVFGDANCDGHIDMSDVVIVMQFLANPDK